MPTDDASQLLWTDDDSAEFRDRLRTFLEQLPDTQRKAFSNIMGGASAAFQLVQSTGVLNNEGVSFGKSLSTFREELPPRQRDAFTSIITAGAIAWGVAADRATEQPPQPPTNMPVVPLPPPVPWELLGEGLELLHLTPVAVIAVGVVLIVRELTHEEEAIVPDIQIPLPEEEIHHHTHHTVPDGS
jgi:hypothetical protein